MSLIKPLMGIKAFIKGLGSKSLPHPAYQGNKIKTKTCLDYGISKYTSTKGVPQPTVTPLGESHIIETLLASLGSESTGSFMRGFQRPASKDSKYTPPAPSSES